MAPRAGRPWAVLPMGCAGGPVRQQRRADRFGDPIARQGLEQQVPSESRRAVGVSAAPADDFLTIQAARPPGLSVRPASSLAGLVGPLVGRGRPPRPSRHRTRRRRPALQVTAAGRYQAGCGQVDRGDRLRMVAETDGRPPRSGSWARQTSASARSTSFAATAHAGTADSFASTGPDRR